jgi:NADH-quinone oxidoreductase subunit J
MTLHGFLFYLLALVVLTSTGLAITRRQLVHAIVYLIISFVGTALIYYLLGAPLLAALEVIIYAGAIMVLFLFIVMTVIVKIDKEGDRERWTPAVILAGISFVASAALIFAVPANRLPLQAGMVGPARFGQFLFERYWFPVEIASLLLFVALVGALYLGKQEPVDKSARKRVER